MGKKGKKGKKVKNINANEDADSQTTEEEAELQATKENVEPQAIEEETEEEEITTTSEEKKEKKAKKGKDEKKSKKRKKSLEAENSRPIIQISITEFLRQHRALSKLGDDEVWTWESYSSVEIIQEEPPKEEEKKVKAKGKGKKGKKGKKEKEIENEKEEIAEGSEDAVSTATDIMAEIKQMKTLADAQALAEAQALAAAKALAEEKIDVVSVAPSKKSKASKKSKVEQSIIEGEGKQPTEKKGPKKKLSKKERARLAYEAAEQARIQAELEAKRAEEEERIRLIQEKKAAIEKEKRELAEQNLRAEHLSSSVRLINLIKKKNLNKAIHDKDQREWENYLKCDELPDPYACGEMNTYLHLWEQVIEATTLDDAAIRTPEALRLLDTLTAMIDDPIGVDQTHIENWKWIHRLFRNYQQRSLDIATFKLLRDINTHLELLDLRHAEFRRQEEAFSICLWLVIRMPKSLPRIIRKPAVPRIKIDIPHMNMHVLFPISFDCKGMAIRGMYLKYDHLSDLCASFDKPPVPEQYRSDLHQATVNEWNSKLYYKYEKHLESTIGEKKSREKTIEDKEKGIIPSVPYQKLEPSASIHIIAEEDIMYLQIRESLMTNVDEYVVNLRKYMILGGIYSLDLFYQLPQPQVFVTLDMTVSRIELPRVLEEVPFHIRYNTPAPIDPTSRREPEEIEEEIKRQDAELDKLLLITLTLPEHVMWLDVPSVCYWDKERKVWTTEDVHDFKHIEDKGYVTFRSSRFGSFALAAFRYSNLPYQAWELKPETDGTVTLQLTAAILLIEFNIKNDLICVLQFQNNTNNALLDIIGIYYKLPQLIRILQEGGVDVFPAFDAFCYIEGTCEKHWPMEKHTYYNMAQLSICYNFAWSRWNLPAGRRSIIMQMREYKPHKVKQIPHSMLLVTPLRAFLIECTEVSQVFSDESEEGMHFYADLYCLMKGISSMATRTKVQSARYDLVGAVADLLIATRVISFS